jgi:hypothetical protein
MGLPTPLSMPWVHTYTTQQRQDGIYKDSVEASWLSSFRESTENPRTTTQLYRCVHIPKQHNPLPFFLTPEMSHRMSNGRDQGGPIGKIVQGVAAGIGLAAEAYHHNKAKKKLKEIAKGQNGDSPRGSSPDNHSPMLEPGEVDEMVWELDAIQTEIQDDCSTSAEPNQKSPLDGSELASSFITHHPLSPTTESIHTDHAMVSRTSRLEMPVILTQRRPKARDRGFIRAYAPILEDVGIDQPTFVEFVDNLNLAVQPSPWIQAINLASFAGMAVPEPFTFLVSVAVSMATAAASEIHSRGKTNVFLDRMNAEFFRPRGLVCLVMTWRPEGAQAPVTQVDFEGRIAEASNQPSTGMLGKFKHTMQSSNIKDSFEWPEVAPLVFPGLEERSPGSDAGEESVMKRVGKFVDDYKDRRAIAKWAGANPESKVANLAPTPTFNSRFADPNHPASSGHLLSLLTGGYTNPPPNPRSMLGRGEQRGQGLQRGRGRLGEVAAMRRGGGEPQGRSVGLAGDGRLGPLSLIAGAKKLLQKVRPHIRQSRKKLN